MKVYKVYNGDFEVEELFTSKSEAEKYSKYLDQYYNKYYYECVDNPTPDMSIPFYYPFCVLEDVVYDTAEEVLMQNNN